MFLTKKLTFAVLAGATTLLSTGVWGSSLAQSYSAKYRSCISQAGSNGDAASACRKDELSRSDAALNLQYKSLYAGASQYRKKLLQKSERAWIQFRDAQCDYEGSQLIGGPLGIQARAQAELQSECVLRETTGRIEALKKAAAQ